MYINIYKSTGPPPKATSLYRNNLVRLNLPHSHARDRLPPFIPIATSAKSTTDRQTAGDSGMWWTRSRGHTSRSDGQVFLVHLRTIRSIRGCGTHCPTPNRFRAPHRVTSCHLGELPRQQSDIVSNGHEPDQTSGL